MAKLGFDRSHRRVLIVDDLEDNRRRYAALVLHGLGGSESHGGIRASVSVSSNGAEALSDLESARARGNPYDVAVIDLMMRPMSGLLRN